MITKKEAAACKLTCPENKKTMPSAQGRSVY